MFAKRKIQAAEPRMPNLNDYPEWRLAETKAKELSTRRRELSERRLQLIQKLQNFEVTEDERVLELLSGDEDKPASVGYAELQRELAAIAPEYSAVRIAQRRHNERMAEIRYRISGEIAIHFEAAHKRAVAGIAEALDQLASALAAEAAVRADLTACGANDLLPSFALDIAGFRQRCSAYAEGAS